MVRAGEYSEIQDSGKMRFIYKYFSIFKYNRRATQIIGLHIQGSSDYNAFHKMIPKTSEGKINNGYEKVFIQVFTKPQWASEDKLKVVCGKGPTPNNPQERLQNIKYDYALSSEKVMAAELTQA